MDPKLQLEIRQLAESWCPTQGHHAAGWKAGFCAFAELVNQLHKQNSTTQQAWLNANIHENNSSLLDQAIADHQDVREAAEIADSLRRLNYHERQAAAESMNKSIWQDRFGQWHGRG
jgi:hypothetical protein